MAFSRISKHFTTLRQRSASKISKIAALSLAIIANAEGLADTKPSNPAKLGLMKSHNFSYYQESGDGYFLLNPGLNIKAGKDVGLRLDARGINKGKEQSFTPTISAGGKVLQSERFGSLYLGGGIEFGRHGVSKGEEFPTARFGALWKPGLRLAIDYKAFDAGNEKRVFEALRTDYRVKNWLTMVHEKLFLANGKTDHQVGAKVNIGSIKKEPITAEFIKSIEGHFDDYEASVSSNALKIGKDKWAVSVRLKHYTSGKDDATIFFSVPLGRK